MANGMVMTAVQFRKKVYTQYRKNRRDLPWRHTTDPYRIMVSEIMLQQTQVDRVVDKYDAFLKRFPTVQSLSRARLSSVVKVWQGLGYNRRAKFLHQAARAVVHEHGGRFPHTIEVLSTLPGIGQHTAGAILAYAFNLPVVYIETNIRSVYIHHFFPKRRTVSDAELLPLIEKTLDRQHPRRWYSALMDYGTWLKKEHGNASRRSRHYTRQSRFEGSHRQVRGAIIRALSSTSRMSFEGLRRSTGIAAERLRPALDQLHRERMITRRGAYYTLS